MHHSNGIIVTIILYLNIFVSNDENCITDKMLHYQLTRSFQNGMTIQRLKDSKQRENITHHSYQIIAKIILYLQNLGAVCT